MFIYKVSNTIGPWSDSEMTEFQTLASQWTHEEVTHFYTEVLVALSPRAGSRSDRRTLALCSCGC